MTADAVPDVVREVAPAKVNLVLHVGPVQANGQSREGAFPASALIR